MKWESTARKAVEGMRKRQQSCTPAEAARLEQCIAGIDPVAHLSRSASNGKDYYTVARAGMAPGAKFVLYTGMQPADMGADRDALIRRVDPDAEIEE